MRFNGRNYGWDFPRHSSAVFSSSKRSFADEGIGGSTRATGKFLVLQPASQDLRAPKVVWQTVPKYLGTC